MTAKRLWTYVPLFSAGLVLAGCGGFGKVEQGRVIAYDRHNGTVTLIRDSTGGKAGAPDYNELPPITVGVPENPAEMGPAPEAGKLAKLDLKSRQITFYDSAAGRFRTVPFVPIEERTKIAKPPAAPPVNRENKTITVYADGVLVTFEASADLLSLPDDTWKLGDEVRYYYKDPARALRMMNVTKTDFNKAGG